MNIDGIPFSCDETGCKAECPNCGRSLYQDGTFIFCETKKGPQPANRACKKPVKSLATEAEAAQWLRKAELFAHVEHLKQVDPHGSTHVQDTTDQRLCPPQQFDLRRT